MLEIDSLDEISIRFAGLGKEVEGDGLEVVNPNQLTSYKVETGSYALLGNQTLTPELSLPEDLYTKNYMMKREFDSC